MMNLFTKLFYKKKHGASSIGVIGASDGPTVYFFSKKSKKEKSYNDEFLEYAATQIEPNNHSFNEIEDYIIKKYNAEPFVLSEKQLQILKSNVIMNHFPEVLEPVKPLGENPTKKQLINYMQNDTRFDQARNYSAEKLGLIMRAYKIKTDDAKDIIIKLEMTTQYMSIDNADRELCDDLCLLRGVTQEDIDNKTPQFMSYAYTLRDRGRIKYN